jgi:pseudouridylate synthase
VDVRVESTAEVVGLWRANRSLELPGSILLCVPAPESAAIPATEIEAVIDEAVGESHRAAVAGREVTPFLLRRIAERTGGRSLEANIALLLNNARVAAGVAREAAAV